jgi:hypothetical protein
VDDSEAKKKGGASRGRTGSELWLRPFPRATRFKDASLPSISGISLLRSQPPDRARLSSEPLMVRRNRAAIGSSELEGEDWE